MLILYVLALFVLFFSVLGVLGLILGWNQAWISLWIGAAFVGLAGFVDIYRRNFLPDEMLVKVRIPKVVPRRELRE